MIKISGPGMLQYLVGTARWLALMRLMADFGSDALAGYTISIRVIIFWIFAAHTVALFVDSAAAREVGVLSMRTLNTIYPPWAIAVAQVVAAIVSAWLFRRGRWKQISV
ncbi:MAG: hypothetical protein O3A57_08415 [Bacteroidetes bacterium]|nr:hypothetical protein [Bacteroidota bacterium]